MPVELGMPEESGGGGGQGRITWCRQRKVGRAGMGGEVGSRVESHLARQGMAG